MICVRVARTLSFSAAALSFALSFKCDVRPKSVIICDTTSEPEARLSAEDHRSSAGVVLNKVPDILRQDRANFHRGTHKDAEDESDGRFGTPENREALGAMNIIVSGGAKAEARIIRGTPLVEVRIAGNTVRVKVISD